MLAKAEGAAWVSEGAGPQARYWPYFGVWTYHGRLAVQQVGCAFLLERRDGFLALARYR